MQRPIIIGIGGFTSNVGKTTLMCDLLRAFPGWEAIKTTRGHYRSCGKDPHTCCVSHLLKDEPVVRSGRESTYSSGKDTGRYWDAGAVNVHWVIATNEQVAAGIKEAIGRVEARGVFVEGNSFSEYIELDFFIMTARSDDLKIKSTARSAMKRVSAFYLSDEDTMGSPEQLRTFVANNTIGAQGGEIPVFSRQELSQLIAHMSRLNPSIAA